METVANNFRSDPLFCDLGAADFTIADTSPLDAANNTCAHLVGALGVGCTDVFLCGDADGNGMISIGDAVYIINYIFAGGPAPVPLQAGDVDCNGSISIGDAVYLINYIFAGGPVPCASCP